MILIKLFLVFFKISFFAVGGAYSFLPLIEKDVVEKYQWMTKSEFIDVLGVTAVFPGAISIKFATYVGYKLAGIPGLIAANIGNSIGPIILIIFMVNVYAKYKDIPAVKGAFSMIRYAVFAMIIAVAFKLVDVPALLNIKIIPVVLVCFVVFFCTKIHPAFIIIGAGICGAVLQVMRLR